MVGFGRRPGFANPARAGIVVWRRGFATRGFDITGGAPKTDALGNAVDPALAAVGPTIPVAKLEKEKETLMTISCKYKFAESANPVNKKKT